MVKSCSAEKEEWLAHAKFLPAGFELWYRRSICTSWRGCTQLWTGSFYIHLCELNICVNRTTNRLNEEILHFCQQATDLDVCTNTDLLWWDRSEVATSGLGFGWPVDGSRKGTILALVFSLVLGKLKILFYYLLYFNTFSIWREFYEKKYLPINLAHYLVFLVTIKNSIVNTGILIVS